MLQASSDRQAAAQRFEARRLSRQLKASRAKLADALAREGELRAGIAVAMAEREKIFTSRTWRMAQSLQKMMSAPRPILASLRPLLRRPAADLVAPEKIAPPPGAEPSLSPYEDWLQAANHLSANDRRIIAARIAGFTHRPLISLILPENGAAEARQRTIRSLEAQLYPDWECVRDLASATGAFIAFLEPSDRLAEEALFEIGLALDAHPETDILYTDEDSLGEDGRHRDPVFKPGFSLDLLLATDMIGGLAVYRRSLLETIDASSEGLALRAALRSDPDRIRHVPHILFHRHRPDRNGSADFLDQPATTESDVPGLPGVSILLIAGHPDWRRVLWPLPDPLPRVSLIIPTRDRADLLARCVGGLLHRTDYQDIEVIILDNDSREPATAALFGRLRVDPRIRILPVAGEFNFSALNNAGVAAATGEIIVMMNNDIDVIDADWLKEMVSHAVQPDVGAVGARLIYENGSLQHAGVVLGVGSHDGGPGIAGHFGHFADGDDDGYLGQYALAREVSAVTGACLAVRRDVWDAVGGLNAADLAVAYNDVDFCLAIRALGWRIIWTPFAELYHLESASRARDETPEQKARAAREARYMRDRWGSVLDKDPFYNANFDRRNHLFQLTSPPPERSWRRSIA